MSTQKLYAGVKLRELRSRLGVTQKVFADKLAVSLPYLNQMENNHRPVSAGVLLRRNAIVMFMCVELMLNAANLAFVTFSRVHGHLDGQVVAFFTMVVAACEVVVGLAIIMTIYRTRRSANVDDAHLLRH